MDQKLSYVYKILQKLQLSFTIKFFFESNNCISICRRDLKASPDNNPNIPGTNVLTLEATCAHFSNNVLSKTKRSKCYFDCTMCVNVRIEVAASHVSISRCEKETYMSTCEQCEILLNRGYLSCNVIQFIRKFRKLRNKIFKLHTSHTLLLASTGSRIYDSYKSSSFNKLLVININSVLTRYYFFAFLLFYLFFSFYVNPKFEHCSFLKILFKLEQFLNLNLFSQAVHFRFPTVSSQFCSEQFYSSVPKSFSRYCLQLKVFSCSSSQLRVGKFSFV